MDASTSAFVDAFTPLFHAVAGNVEKAIRGKADTVRLALVCLFAEGHLLIEDVPGVGKTSLAKAIARSITGTWHRIQFTPDLLPSDITGVSVWNRSTSRFEFRPGGVFADVVLADEINRASPKTQSALLEAMEEQQVTVDGTSYPLPRPFMVIATQNPIELEGTYPLPEAQLDRFLMRIEMGYPDRDAELAILATQPSHAVVQGLSPVTDVGAVLAAIDALASVYVAPRLREYIVDIVTATRRHPDLELGASPRGALGLQRAARVQAATEGRAYVIPDDVKRIAPMVLAHRVILSTESELAGATAAAAVRSIIDRIPIPGPPD